jgi:hypothetical protein
LCLPNLTGGTTFYDIVNHYDVTLNSVASGYGFQASTRRGGFDKAVKLDGVTAHDAKRTASVPVTAFPLTLACWFQPTTGSAEYGLIGIDDGTQTNQIAIELFSSKVNVFLDAGSGEVGTTTTIGGSNTWNFATGTFSQGVQLAYLNGGGKSTTGANASTPTGLTTLRLGSNTFTSTKLNGSIDCCMVYNRVLSDAEILQLYIETQRRCPSLLRRINSPKIFFPVGTSVATPPVGNLYEFNQSVKSASFF